MYELILRTQDQSSEDRYKIVSKPDNQYYLKKPAYTLIDVDSYKTHLRHKDTGWQPFKQKRLDSNKRNKRNKLNNELEQ